MSLWLIPLASLLSAATPDPELLAATPDPELLAATPDPELLAATPDPELLAAAPTYENMRAKLDADREALRISYAATKGRERKLKLASARARLYGAIRDELMPQWFGTPWDFYGTSETPGKGKIACGYFVTTVLRDAALRVERAKLAQQASEKIVKTLSAEEDIRRYRRGDVQHVVDDTKARGDGLYVVGMDFHVAFLDVKGDDVRLCHSAVLAPRAVTCEPAAKAEGMVSAYHVVGPALSDARVLDWLFARAVPTKTD